MSTIAQYQTSMSLQRTYSNKDMTPNDIQTLMTLLQRLQKEADELKAEVERLKEKLEKYESNTWIWSEWGEGWVWTRS